MPGNKKTMKTNDYVIKWNHIYVDPSAPSTGAGCFNTVCVLSEENKPFGYGVAICSHKDNFCKDTGRKISLARALKNANIPKEERKSIWEVYRLSKPNGRW